MNHARIRYAAGMIRPLLATIASLFLLGCSAERSGRLIVIGGGLQATNAAVLGRLTELASRPDGSAEVLIATAASGNETAAHKDIASELEAVRPGLKAPTIGRSTPSREAAHAVSHAHVVFFTGGDQKRITDLYRPGNQDDEVARELRDLLARGGTIAGTSAGDAMMSDPMFFTGGSRRALGFADPTPADPTDPGSERLGPQIGPGMGFLPWVFNDSHFFERHRFGRLVAALEASGKPLGMGVGEDDAVEVDLKTGEARALTDIGALIVDVRSARREGLARFNIRAKLLIKGSPINLAKLTDQEPATGPLPQPASSACEVFRDTPSDRQLGRKLFARSLDTKAKPWRLELDAYAVVCRGVSGGWMLLDIMPTAAK